jgi:hypothetical protein
MLLPNCPWHEGGSHVYYIHAYTLVTTATTKVLKKILMRIYLVITYEIMPKFHFRRERG